MPDTNIPQTHNPHHYSLHDVMAALKHGMHDAGHKITDVGHRMQDAVLHKHVSLCSVCHVELQPEELADGCCADKEACSCRAFSARCF